MRLLVGLDLIGTDVGAVRFAAWLGTACATTLVALHVLQRSELRQILEHTALDEIEREADRRARDLVAEQGAQGTWEAIEVTMGEAADEALARRAETIAADAMVIGRRAHSDGRALIRLGAVARRLLRSLPVAAVVVPPDFDPDACGRGPIVLASDLGAASEGAVRFAKALAERLDRPLVVVHTFDDPSAIAAAHMPVFALGPIAERIEEHAQENTRSWAALHGIGEPRVHVLRGETVGALCRFALHHDATAVVTGSRHASLGARLWLSSVGSGVAGHAHCPVAVVPSDWTERGS